MIAESIKDILNIFTHGGYRAYLVGGCVRDLLMDKEPKDWDITTNARPEEILKIFPNGKYTNVFGTVVIPIKDENGALLEVLEVTTFRSETGYSDKRHPDEVVFEYSLDKDLARRDFTINALAIALDDDFEADIAKFIIEKKGFKVIDFFGGVKDIQQKIIRAVGEPVDRFREDALRILRAARFSAQIGFEIEDKTMRAMTKMAGSVKFLSAERIGSELIKIFESSRPYEGLMILHDTKVLQYILPELTQGCGVDQSRHHVHDVFKHSVLALKYCPSSDWRVRMSAVLHDIAKPKTRKMIDGIFTFYNHELVGARMVEKIMKRLKIPNKDAEKIVLLVKSHMFYYNTDEVTAASVRRLIARVGEENLKDLIDLRIGDRLGSGTAKAKPYKLRHLEYMFERVRRDPVSVKMLAINGDDLQKELGLEPSPKIGAILDCLLGEVLDEAERNTKEYLIQRAKEFNEMDLDELRAHAKKIVESERAKEDEEMKKGYYIK